MGFVRWVVDRQLKAPTADTTVASNMAQSVGNKSDAAVTTAGTTKSIMAYVKGIISILGVTDKTTAGTIIQDGATGDPATITISSSTSADTFGSWGTVDASVAADVWISHVTLYNSGDLANGQDWVLEIGTGASPTAKIRFSGIGTGAILSLVFVLPIPVKVASGTAISARVADQEAAANNYRIGVSYYTGL